ncbi:DEAD/DEAH box helicase [Demequina sediminicola]|uniref:DEAD/DEAH box helicase n=1 Tax=Demequina sediminicola TaxID=1095026 RepID=UPI000782539E|nr:helicase-related protein [Demequina sediminicola]
MATLPEFAYTPAIGLAAENLENHRDARLLVLDTGMPDVVGLVREARYLPGEDTQIPAGIYHFGGLEQPLVAWVPFGSTRTDSERHGLNTLPEDHALANAWRWCEHWWETATEVQAPAYAVRQPVQVRSSGHEVSPSQRRFSNGNWHYKITVDGRTQMAPESSLELPVINDDPVDWVTHSPAPVERFAATLTRAKLTGRLADTLFSFRATRTIFRPYQFKPVMKLLETGKDRILIADEVGLGKTIEAGLVWTELEARGQADKVLIVCPSALVSKWEREMDQRFAFQLEELDNRGLDKLLERFKENRLPSRFTYITSIERLRSWGGLEYLYDDPLDLDLVVVDEAHQMRNTGTKSNDLGTHLEAWSDALVFLTATPINLRERDLFNLLELLVPEDMGDYEDLLERLEPNRALNRVGRMLSDPHATGRARLSALDDLPSSRYGTYVRRRPDFARLRDLVAKDSLDAPAVVEARRIIAGLNTLSTAITRTKKSEVDEDKPVREALWSEVEWTREEKRFYDEFVNWCTDRANEANLPVHFAMQMPLRLASACLPMARRAVLEWSPSLFETDEAEGATVTPFSASQLIAPHGDLVSAANALDVGVDSKFDALYPLLQKLVRERRQVLLFTFSRPTLSYLKARLGSHFRVAVLHGGVNRDDRRVVMDDFRAGKYDIVLANRVASEGLDFEFCSAVINYDLPWNPMEIEQRIGRIDRIGQSERKILVASFRNDATIDERIVARVLDRIQIFEDSIGALEPIVNQQMTVLTKAFDFSLTDSERQQKVDQFLAAVEENRAGLADVADASAGLVVGDDVDVSGLEDDLTRSGKYIGQIELAHLIADWAATDGAPQVKISSDQTVVSVIGNPEMARRVEGLANTHRRTRAEIDRYASALRNGLEMHFALDQELARSGKYDLLTATNPLVVAAAKVPGHREIRFTHARAPRHDSAVPVGTYLVALARATTLPRNESELWGTAVTMRGQVDDGPVSSALLSALARGTLTTPHTDIEAGPLQLLVERAMDHLNSRHQREIQRLQSDLGAMKELRLETLREQHSRRLETMERRLETTRERGVDDHRLRGFEGMRRKAISKHEELILKVANEAAPDITLEPVAVCLLEVTE